MKRILLLPVLALAVAFGASAQKNATPDGAKRQFQVFGVAFYNLENLFDTINNNGKYDAEFSPDGARQWNGRKYWSKISNLARAITAFNTPTTPNGPAFIGVSEIENRSVLEDLVKAIDERLKSEGRAPWNLAIVHHDSPDRRGVDVGALYNPRYFKFMNVVNSTLRVEGKPEFRTRDQMCVTGRMGNDTVDIIVNHWPSRLGGKDASEFKRIAVGEQMRRIADSVLKVNPATKIVAMGDFNDDPTDPSMLEGLNAKPKVKDLQPGDFFSPFHAVLRAGMGTLAYGDAWNLFDNIVVSENLVNAKPGELRLVRAPGSKYYGNVFKRNYMIQREGQFKGYPLRTYVGNNFQGGYSDHFPTLIYLAKEIK